MPFHREGKVIAEILYKEGKKCVCRLHPYHGLQGTESHTISTHEDQLLHSDANSTPNESKYNQSIYKRVIKILKIIPCTFSD